MDKLDEARAAIDRIDAQMAALFEARMAAAAAVAAYKKEHALPVLDSAREAAVVEKNLARLKNKELEPFYAAYLRHQMALSRQYQAQVLGRDRVAYQGVEGAFVANCCCAAGRFMVYFSALEGQGGTQDGQAGRGAGGDRQDRRADGRAV